MQLLIIGISGAIKALRPYLGNRGIGEVGPLDYPMNLGGATL